MTDGNTWHAWKQATFGSDYEIWHDGLYTDAVARLTGDARAQAIAMLRLGLSLGDVHAGEALAAMGDAGDLDTMRQQLQRASGSARVKLALSIHRLQPDPALAHELVDTLQSRLSWSERIDAAIGLRHFDGPADEAALLAAVADRDYLVRYHACESLLTRWGAAQRDIARHPDLFPLICGPQDDNPAAADFARYAEARARLEQLRPR
jgi:hypothetical protein